MWTFSLYLEAVAILPQLVLLQRTRNIDNLTGQYVFLLGAYRGLYILNWVYRYLTEPHYVHWIRKFLSLSLSLSEHALFECSSFFLIDSFMALTFSLDFWDCSDTPLCRLFLLLLRQLEEQQKAPVASLIPHAKDCKYLNFCGILFLMNAHPISHVI
ncbi:hypothetical protein Gotur_033294 [Gossypium turneri]